MQTSRKTIKSLCSSLHCRKANHNKQLIHQVCIEDECQNKQFCCYICKQENHQKHETKSIKIFLSQIAAVQDIGKDILILSAQIDKIGIAIGKMLEDCKQSLANFNVIEQALDRFMEMKKKSVTKLIGLSAEVKQIFKSNQTQILANLLSFYARNQSYLLAEDESNEKENKNRNMLNINLNKIISELKQIQLGIEKLKKTDRVDDFSILAMFPVQQEIVTSFKPYFNENFKASCMKITLKTAEMHVSGTQRVLALSPNLDGNSKIKRWKIKITKLSSWIGVGACHINKLKEANWNFNYSTTKHGSYFISSNGYSWSSFKPQYNSKFQPFSFKTGDTIKLQYLPRQHLLKFQKQQQNATYSLQIENNGDPLHPAINLTGIGDSVEIV